MRAAGNAATPCGQTARGHSRTGTRAAAGGSPHGGRRSDRGQPDRRCQRREDHRKFGHGHHGGTGSVFLRGTNANHTKFLIDGIDVSDPSLLNRSMAHGRRRSGQSCRLTPKSLGAAPSDALMLLLNRLEKVLQETSNDEPA
jgi:dihydroxyacetone kinase